MVGLFRNNFDETHEGGSGQKEVIALLVPFDLAEGNSTSLEAAGLGIFLFGVFDTSSCGASLLDGFASLGLARDLGSFLVLGVGLGGNLGLWHFELEVLIINCI